MSDKKGNDVDKNLITSLDSSSTGSSESDVPYAKSLKTRHTISRCGIGRYTDNDSSLSVDTDMSDILIDSNQNQTRNDVYIRALQNQVKKMEAMYKKKLDDSQLLRLKFCRTVQEANDLKKICHVYEEENKKLREKAAIETKPSNPILPQQNETQEEEEKEPEDVNLEKEYEELLKQIETIENNTLAMKDTLELKSINMDKQEQRAENVNVSDMYLMYKNIETVLKEHNQKFDILANQLNIKYDNSSNSRSPTKITSSSSQTPSDGALDELNAAKVQVEACNNEKLKEYEKMSRLLEDYTEKVRYLESVNADLKVDLETANSSKDSNIRELNKIQDELHEGRNTLQMCLRELKLLKDENKATVERQTVLEQENVDLKVKVTELEKSNAKYMEKLQSTENDLKDYKEKEEEAVYCICELKEELMDKERLYKEKRQRYREKISNISSSEALLKMKLTAQQSLENIVTDLRTENDALKQELEQMKATNSGFQQRLETMENNEKETKAYHESIVENLTLKCECSFKELEEYKVAMEQLELKKETIDKENSKLAECLKAANAQLLEYKETQESLQKTLADQNAMVNGERERIENEIEDANVLSNYLNEQLNIAKMKYNELLPLTDNCCCKHITEIIFWLHKQNEHLKTTQSNLMQNLQIKLSEARQKNNVDTFTVVKDLINLILESTADKSEMSVEMKIAFEKLMEKRKYIKEDGNNDGANTTICWHTPSNLKKSKFNNKIDVIMEEVEVEECVVEEVKTVDNHQPATDINSEPVEIQNKESERCNQTERNPNDTVAVEEPEYRTKSQPVLTNQNSSKNLFTNSRTSSPTKLSSCQSSSSTNTCSCHRKTVSEEEESQLKSHQNEQPLCRQENDPSKYQQIPYISIDSPKTSSINFKQIPCNNKKDWTVKTGPSYEISRPTSGEAPDSSLASTCSDPIIANARGKYKSDMTFSDSESSDKSIEIELFDTVGPACKMCRPGGNNKREGVKRPKRSSSNGSTTRIDDYLNKLSRMEKRVANVRMELRTSSASRVKMNSDKIPEASAKRGNVAKTKTIEAYERHNYRARSFDAPDRIDTQAFAIRKDCKKFRRN